MTREEERKINRYYDADDTDIYDAYARPSKVMVDAYRNCIKRKVELDGTDFRITGHSSYMFSCAFRYKEGGVEYLKYITKHGETDINLDEYRRTK